jgi:hypothetical protein
MAAKAETKKTVDTFEGEFAILDETSDIAGIIEENLAGEGLRPTDLPRVTFPREASSFDIPDALDPTGVRSVREIVGVPVRQQVTRAMYLEAYQSGSTDAPDCHSNDGVNGIPNPDIQPVVTLADGTQAEFGGMCLRCPLNEWGSNLDGRPGKQCSEYRSIVIVEPERPFPIVLRLPPTQLGAWRQFGLALTNAGVRIHKAVVGFAIQKKNDRNELAPVLRGVLPEETASALRGVMASSGLLSAPSQKALSAGSDEPPPYEPDEVIDADDLPF